jgi:hypothetical protein
VLAEARSKISRNGDDAGRVNGHGRASAAKAYDPRH